MFVLPWCQNRHGIQSGLPNWKMLRPLKEAKYGKATGIIVSPLWLKNSHKINARIYIKLSCMTLYKFLAYGAYYEFQVRRKDGSRKNLSSVFNLKDSLYISFKRGFLNSINIDFNYIQDKIFLKDCRNMNESQSTF